MSEPSKRPQSRDGRTKSAVARLRSPPNATAKNDGGIVMRGESALLNRDKQKSSKKVFPRPTTADKERYKTQYSRDYDGTYMAPMCPRPSSPTRRNNPHPTKQFMVWRVPSREIGGTYEDEFPDLGEEFEFDQPFERTALPPPRPTSKDYGSYLVDRLPSRQSRRGEREYQPEMRMGEPLPRKPVKTKRIGPEILDRTLKGGNVDALSSWLKTAPPDEQQTVLKMLRQAENSQINQTISDVMQPAAAKAVSQWMNSVDERERDVAVRLFSSLGSRQGRRRRHSLPAIRPSSSQQHMSGPPPQGSSGKPWPASLWHVKPIRDPPPQIYHRGSLFGTARGSASHYTIHPEWPDYQHATFNTDLVQ